MPKMVKDASFGAVVLTMANTVLLIKQLSQNGSYWALPKGHKDTGESDEQAAIREVNEECGLALTIDLLVPGVWHKESYKYRGPLHGDAWTKHSVYPDESKRPIVLYDKIVAYGIALVKEEMPVKPQEEEIEEVAWVPYDEAITRLRHKSQQDAVIYLCSAISR